jgi:uncharacterized protein involved in oxidation of intracellular sulfur
MKIGIIIETKEPEKSWNALRFAVTALKADHAVKVFLMGEAVEIQHMSDNKYDAAAQLHAFDAAGGTILACGTCLQSRMIDGNEVCPISTMTDCLDMVTWADRVVTF